MILISKLDVIQNSLIYGFQVSIALNSMLNPVTSGRLKPPIDIMERIRECFQFLPEFNEIFNAIVRRAVGSIYYNRSVSIEL